MNRSRLMLWVCLCLLLINARARAAGAAGEDLSFTPDAEMTFQGPWEFDAEAFSVIQDEQAQAPALTPAHLREPGMVHHPIRLTARRR